MERRSFLKLTAAGAGAALAGIKSSPAADAPAAPAGKGQATIAIPIAAGPLARNPLDPDVRGHADPRRDQCPQCLSSAGMRPIGAERRRAFLRGNYAIPHMQYYRDQPLTYQDMRGPEFGDVDVLERVIPGGAPARDQGVRCFSPRGQRPAHRRAALGNHVRGGPPRPPQRRSIRAGPATTTRPTRISPSAWSRTTPAPTRSAASCGARSARAGSRTPPSAFPRAAAVIPGRATCSRVLREERAAARDRRRSARRGFGEVEKFIKEGRASQRPRDGYFTTFWRTLLDYPELLAWANLLGDQPARAAGFDLPEGEADQPRTAGGLACLAEHVLQPFPAGGGGLRHPRRLFRFPAPGIP